MAWTAPMTAVANAAFTAAQFNTHVRDNLNETAPAKATTQGGYFVTTALNSIVERVPGVDSVATSETTTSTAYADLTTAGPTITATTGPTALILIAGQISNNTADGVGRIGFVVSGATTIAETDILSLSATSGSTNDGYQSSSGFILTGLTGGSNTFKLRYKTNVGTATFSNRRISIVPF